MRCANCKLSERNSVHQNPQQFGYHGYVEPREEPELVDVLDRLMELEERLARCERSLLYD